MLRAALVCSGSCREGLAMPVSERLLQRFRRRHRPEDWEDGGALSTGKWLQAGRLGMSTQCKRTVHKHSVQLISHMQSPCRAPEHRN